MPSTSAPISNPIGGITMLPGLQVSPYGAAITQFKVYNFGITDTRQITATSTSGSYTISGLTTNDIPMFLTPSTSSGGQAATAARPGNLFVSAANTLDVAWTESGTSTGTTPGTAAPGTAWTLMTFSYSAQSSSTTT
jgi:hypothetical protein